jgi:hypothetical protein
MGRAWDSVGRETRIVVEIIHYILVNGGFAFFERNI